MRTPMRLLLRERILPLAVLLGIRAAVPVGLLLAFGHRMVMFGTPVHFVGVGVSALAAAAVSLALTLVGVRRNDGRVVLIGTGFTVMSALLAIHGLATPGALIGPNGVISLTGAATLPAGAAVLALFAVLGLGIVGMAFPSVVPPVPAPRSGGAVVALFIGVALFAVLLLRALKTYLLTHRSADMAVVIGIAWLTAALPPALLMDYMDLGWWLGHLFELLGIVVVGATVAIDLFRSAQSRSLVGDLRAGELVAEEEAFLGARVRALTQLLHDIGKLSVPERILKKPAALDDAEFAAIKLHPGRGVQLLRELGGFAAAIHDLVHSHHERLDGKGYPRGLTDCELSLDTRILTVCDVYDALVSPRVYREAWTHDAALALLRDETATAFDERCVAALERVLSREGQGEHAPMPVLRVAAAGA